MDKEFRDQEQSRGTTEQDRPGSEDRFSASHGMTVDLAALPLTGVLSPEEYLGEKL